MEKNWKKRGFQIGFVVVSLAIIILCVKGGFSAATAPDKDKEEMTAMKEEFERNAKKLEEEHSSAKKDDKKSEKTSSDSSKNEKDSKSKSDKKETKKEEQVITAIGDSVMLGASPALMDVMPGCFVDAAESRQVSSTIEILQSLEAEGKLGNTIILGLGTNGPFSESVGQKIIDYLGKDRDIYWVTVYAESVQWMDESNDTIRTLADKNDNVSIIDWESEGTNHPEWFYADGIHLREDEKGHGQSGYAKFVSGIVVK